MTVVTVKLNFLAVNVMSSRSPSSVEGVEVSLRISGSVCVFQGRCRSECGKGSLTRVEM